MAALGLGQATGGNNGRRNLKLENCSWSLELMSKPKALFRYPNSLSNFTMQKEDSPSYQNIGTYMEY
jgi:hypothetical protein